MASVMYPWVLVFLIGVPIAFFYYRHLIKKKRKEAFAFSRLSSLKAALGSQKKSRYADVMFYLMLASSALLFIALADPSIQLKQANIGVNVVLVMDVSGSMQASDYKPSRLEAAKGAAEILLRSLDPKDHAGIVIFETGATTAAYLSPFKERVIEKLQVISPREGRTAIGDGLSLGIDMALSIPNKKRVVILLSDGVNNAGVISPEEAVSFARANKIEVFTVGMGTAEKTVLGYDRFGNPQYAELDENLLRSIAQSTGGHFYRSINEQTLDEIYGRISEQIIREEEETSVKDWFIVLALVVLIIQMAMRYGRKMIIQ